MTVSWWQGSEFMGVFESVRHSDHELVFITSAMNVFYLLLLYVQAVEGKLRNCHCENCHQRSSRVNVSDPAPSAKGGAVSTGEAVPSEPSSFDLNLKSDASMPVQHRTEHHDSSHPTSDLCAMRLSASNDTCCTQPENPVDPDNSAPPIPIRSRRNIQRWSDVEEEQRALDSRVKCLGDGSDQRREQKNKFRNIHHS